ncbi:ABC transporter permease [Roseivirga sp. BDSF3-8]|uniref:ABC transporter permease n=1 Tax=Roseivirga sp. BDSF3-8 TaxID=3241598 RepID=UPI0035327DCC
MLKFIFKRLFYGLLVVLGVVLVVFFLFHALPGDPVAMMAGQRTDISTQEAIKKELGLDKPLMVQLGRYLNDLSPVSVHEDTPENEMKYEYTILFGVGGDDVLVVKAPYLRRSFQTNRRVGEVILENVEATLWLAIAAMVLATALGVMFGLISALYQNSFWDHFLVSTSVLGISVPSFVSAIIIAMIFGYYLADYTGLNLTGQLWVNDAIYGRELHLENLILPAFTLGIRPLSIIVQLTRSSMLEVLSQDYIRTAQAKGLRFYKVVTKHALKNALNPVITAVSGWLASLMAGAFFVEYIFDWKGLGYVTISAVQSLDFPVVMGAVLFIALVFVVINIFVDIVYALLDPRVRLS